MTSVGSLKLAFGHLADWTRVGVTIVVILAVVGTGAGVHDAVPVVGAEYTGCYLTGEGADFNLWPSVEKTADFEVSSTGKIVENSYD